LKIKKGLKNVFKDYLSSVHRTFATIKDKKEIAQKRNNLEKVFNKKLIKIEEKIRSPIETKFLNFSNLKSEERNKNFNNSQISSVLQSIALSEEENEINLKKGEKNKERFSLI
jgi:hypothetical protein